MVWVSIAAGLLLASWLWLDNDLRSSAALAGAVLSSGLAAGQLAAFHYPSDHVSAFADETPRLAQLEIYIDDAPRVLVHGFGGSRPLPPKQVTTATVRRLRTWDGWIDCSGRILVQIAEPHPRLAQNQTVRALGMLERPSPAVNPGQFDWAKYYREQRVLTSLQIGHADNLLILTREPLGPVQWLRRAARSLLAQGFTEERSLDHALLRALVLGDNDPELRDVQEQFRKTGTSHHLAISGMHIAVLGGVVFLVCRLLRVSPRRAAVLALGWILLYAIIVLPSPPVVRSVLLCLSLFLGVLWRRSVDPLQLLCLAAVVMLIYHPLDLFNSGFQLSFGTVAGLMLLGGPLARWLSREDPDQRVLRAHSRGSRTWRWVDSQVVSILAASFAAWWVSMPLVALHFEQLNTWAVLGSLVLAPVVFVALTGGLLKILLTLFWPSLASVWATLAAGPVWFMRKLVEWLTRLPWADVPLPAPHAGTVTLFFALTLLLVWPRLRAGMKWSAMAGCCVALAAILLFPFRGRLSGSPGMPLPRSELRMTLLSVGAGQCAVIEPPGGRVVLVDAGSISLIDPLRKCIGPYLRSRGITDVDTIAISHANTDHFNAVAFIAQAYDVREVLVAPTFRHNVEGNIVGEAMLKALEEWERPPRLAQVGDVIPLGRDTSLQILWPGNDLSLDANDASMVLKLRHAGRSILFTGDLQEAGMRHLLQDPDPLRCDVLLAPHHGSSEPVTAEFVAATGASVVLSSNDRTLSFKQRNFEKLIGDKRLYRTHADGAITITVGAAGQLHVEPFRRAER